jgi:hypothetical protein
LLHKELTMNWRRRIRPEDAIVGALILLSLFAATVVWLYDQHVERQMQERYRPQAVQPVEALTE